VDIVRAALTRFQAKPESKSEAKIGSAPEAAATPEARAETKPMPMPKTTLGKK
jgi:hypothetical protein